MCFSCGGVVRFLPGVYVTGSLFIKSNVELRIDDKVLILGSQNFDDYPEIQTRIAGIETTWPAALNKFDRCEKRCIDRERNYQCKRKILLG
jgi:polygalacturonase